MVVKAELVVNDGWDGLFDTFQRISQLPTVMSTKVIQYASVFESELHYRLTTQGRPGGTPPPLSRITTHLYSRLGPPDGSGIRNHIERIVTQQQGEAIAIVGIKGGRPTEIARKQNYGAVVPVTDAMRAFLSANGINLRSDTHTVYIPARFFWTHSVENVRVLAMNELRQSVRDHMHH